MIRIQNAASTHVGRVRDTNQDRALVSGQLTAVADGMGGHAGGDKAAALAIAELSGVRGTISAERLIRVVQVANERIFAAALAPELRGMGTTIVAAVVDNETAVMSLINVGDSRGYQYRDGVFGQVTEDHSLVEDLIRSGRLTEEEAKVHPQRNIVTRVLGIGEEVDVDLFQIDVEVGDRYLLCSDGLSNEVDDQEIAAILERFPDCGDAADELVTAAVSRGGRDNVTVAVIDIVRGAERASDQPTAPTASSSPTNQTDLDRLLSVIGENQVIGEDQSDQPSEQDKASQDQDSGASEPSEGPRPDESMPPPPMAPPPKKRRWYLPLRSIILGTGVLGVALVATISSSWYAKSSWYADDIDGEVVILQGRPGGFLWHDPSPVEATGVSVSDLNGTSQEHLTSQTPWSSLDEAKDFVENLEQDSTQASGG